MDTIGQLSGGNWQYFGTDGLGSVRFMIDPAQTITSATNYDPYGQVLEQYMPGVTNLGFTGEQTDASGLQYLRARYYNPETGVFLSRDPIQGIMGVSQSYNGYNYAFSNPVTLTDPTGLSPLCPGGFFGELCSYAFGSLEAGTRGAVEAAANPVAAASYGSEIVSTEFYNVTQTHWAGSAAAGFIDPVDIGITINNWLNGDFFILDPLAFLPVVTVGFIRNSFRQVDNVDNVARGIGYGGDNIARGADNIGTRGFKYLDDEIPSDHMINQQLDMSCAAACGVQMLKEEGIVYDEETLRHLMEFDEVNGIFLEAGGIRGLNDSLRGTNAGFRFNYAQAFDYDEIIPLLDEGPVMVNLNRHAVLVDRITDSKVYIRDPWGKGPGSNIAFEGTLRHSSFNQLWMQGRFQYINIVRES